MTQPTDHGENLLRQSSVRRTEKTARTIPTAGTVAPSGAALSNAVRLCVGDQNFRHWFMDRSRLDVAGDQLVVHVANPFICSWIMKRFRQQLSAAAVEILGPSAAFVVHVDAALGDRSGTPKDTARPSSGSGRSRGRPTLVSASDQHAPPPTEVSDCNTGKPAQLMTRPPTRRRFRGFNSFVFGPCNELSVMAARQVSEAPGERFNPLYLHGSTGVGKSHLLEAIYSTVRKTHPGLSVLLLTSESFTNYFTAALASRSVPSFRQRFRSIDVLLVDNIEFLGNKKATQEEFLHTIDQLIDHGGQLVLTGDRHPRLLTRHREELTTRFIGGLVCKIERPAECTRRKLIESLALPYREQLSPGALNYVACHGGRNARELQGSLNCLVSHAALRGSRVTTSQARNLLGRLKEECRHLVQINDVERIVCEAFGVSVHDMRSKTRRKAISSPRSIAMYVARRLTKAAWREIGQYFGGRDHSTVVAAAKRVDVWINETVKVDLPNSCRGTTWGEVVQEIEERLLAS
ncbi:MAG: chromosomal replication initiator protein DnaA [Planctomycetaceae bacterium]